MSRRNLVLFVAVFAALACVLLPSLGHASVGQSIWSGWLPEAVTPSNLRIHHFNDMMMWIISGIVFVVLVLMTYVIVRYRKSVNPNPSKVAHNVPLEIVWTLIPCLILLVIMVPSLRLMYYTDITHKPDLTLKVTGYQWFWGYSYPDQEIDEFMLNYIPDAQADPKGDYTALRAMPTYQRLLSTFDLASGKPAFVVLPVNKNIRVQITAGDVIHSFAMPAFGVKKDAVPGRLNETWFNIEKTGIYYGQCSEICGINHGFMPIEIRAVEQEQFDQWANLMKEDSSKAMAYIQDVTVQYAHPQLEVPRMKLQTVWDELKHRLNLN